MAKLDAFLSFADVKFTFSYSVDAFIQTLITKELIIQEQ